MLSSVKFTLRTIDPCEQFNPLPLPPPHIPHTLVHFVNVVASWFTLQQKTVGLINVHASSAVVI